MYCKLDVHLIKDLKYIVSILWSLTKGQQQLYRQNTVAVCGQKANMLYGICQITPGRFRRRHPYVAFVTILCLRCTLGMLETS